MSQWICKASGVKREGSLIEDILKLLPSSFYRYKLEVDSARRWLI